MANAILETLIADGRLDEVIGVLRQVSLAHASPPMEPLRREVVQQAFRVGELTRRKRRGLLQSSELAGQSATLADALAELVGEFADVVGNDMLHRHAAAHMALAREATPAAIREDAAPTRAAQAPPQHQVFISYASDDFEIAKQLAGKLDTAGVGAWLDANRLTAGDRYSESIIAALDAARAVVVLWTPVSCKSDWVRYEARRAHSQGKHVPLLAGGLVVDDMPPPYPAVIHAPPISFDDLAAALRRLFVAI